MNFWKTLYHKDPSAEFVFSQHLTSFLTFPLTVCYSFITTARKRQHTLIRSGCTSVSPVRRFFVSWKRLFLYLFITKIFL